MELLITEMGKRYQKFKWAVEPLNMRLTAGVIGLLGPNGAGKTTLMRILATLDKPTVGVVTFNGVDIAKEPEILRNILGYLPQRFGVYPNLNAVEFLEYIAALKGVTGQIAKKRIDYFLESLNLTEVKNRPLKELSSGMKQRVGIAQALFNDPKLLIVDEPTVGLDPVERVRFRNLLCDSSRERIVIFSTHIVSDIEMVASQIAVMKKGKLLIQTKPDEMLQKIDGKVWELTIPQEQLSEAKQKWLISNSLQYSNGVRVRIVSDTPPSSEATMVSSRLEDAYLKLIATKEEHFDRIQAS